MSEAIETAGGIRDVLGECPIWDQKLKALYWIDIRAKFIRRLDPATDEVTSWPAPDLPGSFALMEDGRLLVALKTSIAIFDPATGGFETVHRPAFKDPAMRYNDGRTDRQGRFFVGSMQDPGRGPIGELFRIDGRFLPEPVFGGIHCPNGLCWSPDGKTMYYADSDRREIVSYPFDTGKGTVGAETVMTAIDPAMVPDGSTVDAEGHIWCALYGGSKVIRVAPSGKVVSELKLPVTQPTCCAFGGEDLKTLYITTASQRLTDEQLASQPLAGRLLMLRVDVPGLPEPLFRL